MSYMYDTNETKKIVNVSNNAIKDVQGLLSICYSLRSTASHQGFYDGLKEWSTPIYDYIDNILKKYGFVNGDPEYNKRYPDIQYWWGIYGMMNNIIYSPNLYTRYPNHHSTAYERNEALIVELEYLIKR